jgi:putative DNA-invertase from lambdoid prophage Rac
VAVYCRVPTDDHSCERQERDLRAFAKRAGHKFVALFKETASGADNGRPQRAKVLAWQETARSMLSWLPNSADGAAAPKTSPRRLTICTAGKSASWLKRGLSFDLSTSGGKLMYILMAGLAEFERDLIRDRVKSGLQAARARGVKLGRQHGQRPSDKKAQRVLAKHKEGLSYRLIGRNVGLSKNTVMEIVRREDLQFSTRRTPI